MDSEETQKLRELHTTHIQGTVRKAPIKYERILLGHLATVAVSGVRDEWSDFNAQRVYITTKALKHIFDQRQAQEYDSVLCNLPEMINQPDVIYENVDGKRGELALVKSFQVRDYQNTETTETFFAALQIIDDELNVATAFRFSDQRRHKNYLNTYKLLWSWGDG